MKGEKNISQSITLKSALWNYIKLEKNIYGEKSSSEVFCAPLNTHRL